MQVEAYRSVAHAGDLGWSCDWGGMLTPEQAMAMIEHCSDLTDAAHPEIPDSDGSEEGGE